MWSDSDIKAMRAAILAWYDAEGRTLPWRVRPEDRVRGARPEAYAVWLSEVMLQQTTIAHGTPYWRKFLSLYPTVEDLAAAPLDEVLTHWAGLGYYARARNLHKCAKIIAEAGEWPTTRAGLIQLPGIGDYTASTIAAICFDEPTTIVDGNVERVMARLHAVETPVPKARPELKRLAAVLSDPDRPGDYGQAVMDLGATVCTPRSPGCLLCPWQGWCVARREGEPERYPVKAKKRAVPEKRGHAWVALKNGDVWLRRRPEDGLLGGMMEVPTGEWAAEAPEAAPPLPADWTRQPAPVRHVFSHFALTLEVWVGEVEAMPGEGGWVAVDALDGEALPSLFRKVLKGAGV